MSSHKELLSKANQRARGLREQVGSKRKGPREELLPGMESLNLIKQALEKHRARSKDNLKTDSRRQQDIKQLTREVTSDGEADVVGRPSDFW